jgi:hypothetical protein
MPKTSMDTPMINSKTVGVKSPVMGKASGVGDGEITGVAVAVGRIVGDELELGLGVDEERGLFVGVGLGVGVGVDVAPEGVATNAGISPA